MSIQTVNNNSMIPLINGFKELDTIITLYLRRSEFTILASESSPFRNLPAIEAVFRHFAKEDSECLAMGFSQPIVQTFCELGLSLLQIPRLNLSAKSLRPCVMPEEMQSLSMGRFEVSGGQPALALYVKAEEEKPYVFTFYSIDKTSHLWSTHSSDLPSRTGLPSLAPETAGSMMKKILSNTLTYRLIGEIPQVEPPTIKEAEKTENPST